MSTSDWPHEKIRSAALHYIRKHSLTAAEWRFTCLDALPQRLARIVKHSGRAEVEVATLALATGRHMRIPYETGSAAMSVAQELARTRTIRVLGEIA
jgi:hypothetical protein